MTAPVEVGELAFESGQARPSVVGALETFSAARRAGFMIEQLFVRVIRPEAPCGFARAAWHRPATAPADGRWPRVASALAGDTAEPHAESGSQPSDPTGVHMAPNDKVGSIKAGDREKVLETALAQIERQFGRGAIMRLGDDARAPVEVIPTGSIALDVALGIGGLPRGRIVEIYGPESSGKTTLADTYVWTDRGLETIAEIFARAGMNASCTSRVTDVRKYGIRLVNERGELESVAALTHNNRKPVLRLRLRSGRVISVTHNHPLRVMSERGFIVWRKAGKIQPGDTLVSATYGGVEAAEGTGISEDEAILLGYL